MNESKAMSNYQRGRFDAATEYQRAIRALTRPQPGGAGSASPTGGAPA